MEARAESYRFEARQAFNADERIVSLFEPDTLLSAQYFENLRRKTLVEPEKRLMLAILVDAINCYQENLLAKRGRAGRLFTEAEEWILEKGSDWIFSFKNICETLGFNPEYVRQGLLQWKEKKTAKRSHFKYWVLGKEKDTWISLGERILDNLTQIESI
jgi:hypothetical protein